MWKPLNSPAELKYRAGCVSCTGCASRLPTSELQSKVRPWGPKTRSHCPSIWPALAAANAPIIMKEVLTVRNFHPSYLLRFICSFFFFFIFSLQLSFDESLAEFRIRGAISCLALASCLIILLSRLPRSVELSSEMDELLALNLHLAFVGSIDKDGGSIYIVAVGMHACMYRRIQQ